MNDAMTYDLTDKCPSCGTSLIAIKNPHTSMYEVDCSKCAKNLDRDLTKEQLFLIYDVDLK